MGRQMASHGFRRAQHHGGGNPQSIKALFHRHIFERLLLSGKLYLPVIQISAHLQLSASGVTADQPDRHHPHPQHPQAPFASLPTYLKHSCNTWDALICTSAALSAVEAIWDHCDEICHFRGGKPAPRPQLPLIPLGINAADFSPVCSRTEARRRLKLPKNALVLRQPSEMHRKAHHGTTFRALAHAPQPARSAMGAADVRHRCNAPDSPALKEAAASMPGCGDALTRWS